MLDLANGHRLAPRTLIKVISVLGASKRRELFSNAASTDLKWSFLDAQTGLGSDLHINAKRMKIAAGRLLEASELGCYSSHFVAWKELLVSDAAQMIVFEDDALIDWDYIEFLVTLDFASLGIDYLKLCAKVPGRFRRVRQEFPDRYHHLVQYLGPALGTQAYFVTRPGASTLVHKLRQVTRAIDEALDRSWDHGLPNLAIFPFPVVERFVPSSIGTGRFASHGAGIGESVRTGIVGRLEQGRRVMVGFSRKPAIKLVTAQ